MDTVINSNFVANLSLCQQFINHVMHEALTGSDHTVTFDIAYHQDGTNGLVSH